MIRPNLVIHFLFSSLFCQVLMAQKSEKGLHFFPANDPRIQYFGRIDFSNPASPVMWQPGVYFRASFSGSACMLIVKDQLLWGNSHNYLEIVVDDHFLYRVQTKNKTDTIELVRGLSNGQHTLLVCKNTEANIGYIRLLGFICESLNKPPSKPARKFEFIGNSITCGTGSDLSKVPCGSGQWQDQHNAYLSYGPVTARMLHGQWMLSAVSGIGLTQSCCGLPITMPQVFDKVNMRDDSIVWNFEKYQPDCVTICLGQNDGIQDSARFCTAYVRFIKTIRRHYSHAVIVCLGSPMADERLLPVMKRYIGSVVNFLRQENDRKVYAFFFSRRYQHGCDGHPDLAEHQQMAGELAPFLEKRLGW
jgi:Carbohydrate esterase 2 N-terminal/GDSL-like Lipase/Acylhydrolase family